MARGSARNASWLLVGALALLGASADAATLDASAGTLTYVAASLAVNAVTVSLSAGSYTIDDPGEAAISLGAGALAAGCANVDANTVTCPESAISAWNVQLADQADSANLSAILEPTTIRGGQGNDTLIGGSGADTFTWFPGDASDSVDGGPGADTLDWDGANINENYNVSAIVDGFQVTRDVAVVTLQALRVEALILQTLGGDDTVTTHPLPATTQSLDGGTQSATDTLVYDAGGACTTQTASSLQSLGGQIVTFGAFEAVNLANQCTVFPAALEIAGGVLTYTAGAGAANSVAVSLASGSYTIDDTAVPAITLGAGALVAGCANLDTNTVTCPQSAIGAWSLLLGDQADAAMLAAVVEPTTIRGGQGADVLVGGSGPDTFTWFPGDASDTIDGGPGADTLDWNGANINENYNVSAIVDGFQVTRDVAVVTLQALRVEALTLQTLGGDDTVTTHPLPATTQSFDGGTQSATDTLVYDAGGACTTQTASSLQSLGGQIATHTGFEAVNLINQCSVFPSSLEISGGQLTYAAAAGALNALTVSSGAGSYTIDDTGEPAITLGSGALAAGCVNLDLNTARCPKSAISSWNVQLGDQADSASLSGVLEPTTIRGGQGSDVLTGGSGPDTFMWFPGDASDTLDGGPGTDTLDWDGANIGEHYTISPTGGGFQVLRDVAAVTLSATGVELLVLQTLGGDDIVTTHPLPLTTQSLDAGTQSAADTLVYDADLACTSQGFGSFQSAGGQIVLHTGFETLSLIDQCANPTPVPALGSIARAMLVVGLALAIAWLGARRVRAAR